MPYNKQGNWYNSSGGEVLNSYPRRLSNNFFQKYLKNVNTALEIGGTEDPLVDWAEHYDQHHFKNTNIDATYCKELESEKYDLVHASHVLEHIANCYLGLKNWFRLVKKGGLLIFTVPHVDLYERKTELPSEGNGDHKFFIHDSEERLPFTINLKHLIESAFSTYDYEVLEYNICENSEVDNRLTKWPTHPTPEYQIEVIIRRN
tara:strand:+ start:126 stop:737 length:612 start_codon:yes stop_codon:yes gene_type:complete